MAKGSRSRGKVEVRVGPRRDDPHEVVYFRRHVEDDPRGAAPGREFLAACPPGVRAKFMATLVAVATAPPHKFAGGGMWEAMHGEMSGWFEVRRDGRQRHHYRLFCLIDLDAAGAKKPWLVVVCGLDKPFKTVLSESDYQWVRSLGEEYLARNPRSISEESSNGE